MTLLLALLAIGLQEPSCKVTAQSVQGIAQAGRPVAIAVQFEMEPGWHIYWKNPGDSGEATRIKWALPEGWKEVDVRFPTPHAIDAGGVTNYGYEDKVTLIARLMPPSNYQGESVNLAGEATYLICKEACLPGSRKFSVAMPGTPLDHGAWKIANSALPVAYQHGIEARYSSKGMTISLQEKKIAKAHFFAENENLVAHSSPQHLQKTAAGFDLMVPLSDYLTSRPKKVVGVLVLTRDDASVRGYNVELTPENSQEKESNKK